MTSRGRRRRRPGRRRRPRSPRPGWPRPRRRTGRGRAPRSAPAHVDRGRCVVAPRPGERPVEADDAGQAEPQRAARNDIRPPMQNPIVNSDPGAARPSSGVRSSSTAAVRSASIPRHVVCATCGLCSKPSPRGSAPAVRPNQSSASASIPSRRTAGPAPRSTDGARGRRAGSRPRPRSARWRASGTPRTGCGRRPSGSAASVDRPAGDRPDRRMAVEIEAHAGRASGRWIGLDVLIVRAFGRPRRAR